MPLFEFELKPLPDVLPWERDGIDFLHWFGLTDGIYHLNVNGIELFKYSKEYHDYLIKMFPDDIQLKPYIDYQVIRLYEDFLEILPNVLQSIPNNLINFIGSTLLEKQIWEEFELMDVDDKKWDTYANATRWWGCRHLNSMHLRNDSNIVFWNYNDEIHIRWDNSDFIEDGIQVWESLKGGFKYPKNEFINEVYMFHNRLMNEMENRIKEIEDKNPIPHIQIDLNQIKNEQKERLGSLQNAINRKPEIDDWDEVYNSLISIKNMEKGPR